MTAKEKRKQKDQELVHRLHEKYYGNKKQKEGVATRAIKTEPTRNDLMLRAKEKGIKNFRILNKEELKGVLDPGIAVDAISKIVQGAVARWKAGWGTKQSISEGVE